MKFHESIKRDMKWETEGREDEMREQFFLFLLWKKSLNMIDECFLIDKSYVIHTCHSLCLFSAEAEYTEDKLTFVNVELFSQGKVFVDIMAEFPGFAFDAYRSPLFKKEEKVKFIGATVGKGYVEPPGTGRCDLLSTEKLKHLHKGEPFHPYAVEECLYLRSFLERQSDNIVFFDVKILCHK